MDKDYFYRIVYEIVVDITKRLTGIGLAPMLTVQAARARSGCATLKILVKSKDAADSAILCQTHPEIYVMIAERMKGAALEDEEEMEMYIKEYFNILCGRIISRINRDTKSSMRFGIPMYYKNGICEGGIPVWEMTCKCPEKESPIYLAGIGKQFAI